MNASHPLPELDVRTLVPRDRHERIFATWEACPPGGGFVLVNDHDPKPLLYQFQAEHAGAFDWHVLEAGPERWRVAIVRRADPALGTVHEFLEQDHARLDDLADTIAGLVDGGVVAPAADRLAEYACGLNRHIDMEERVLFPSLDETAYCVEERTGSSEGPTAVMRGEHAEIRRLLAESERALHAGDLAGFRTSWPALMGRLAYHNRKEEDIIYIAADDLAATGPRFGLVHRMQTA